MSKESKRTAPLAADLRPEHVVRGAVGRWRRTPPATPTDEVNGLPADPATAAHDAASPARRTTPLRRWSVAELIARAVASRPADGMSH
jgi:hypothetical protein